mgnify:CR=1 FL=1
MFPWSRSCWQDGTHLILLSLSLSLCLRVSFVVSESSSMMISMMIVCSSLTHSLTIDLIGDDDDDGNRTKTLSFKLRGISPTNQIEITDGIEISRWEAPIEQLAADIMIYGSSIDHSISLSISLSLSLSLSLSPRPHPTGSMMKLMMVLEVDGDGSIMTHSVCEWLNHQQTLEANQSST